jgi:hypothetical protein
VKRGRLEGGSRHLAIVHPRAVTATAPPQGSG